MYNNEVTYHKKWDTESNKYYQKMAMDLVQDKSYCACDVPRAWAKEVYELLKEIDTKYGIEYNTTSYRGYSYTRNLIDLFIKRPFGSLFYYHTLSKWELEYAEKKGKPTPKSGYRIGKNIKEFKRQMNYAFSVNIRNIKAYFYNKYRKPQVGISQVKEKYGTFRLYFSAPGDLDNAIDRMVEKMEIKLARKGAYFPIEEMKKWSTTTYGDNDEKMVRYPYKELLDADD